MSNANKVGGIRKREVWYVVGGVYQNNMAFGGLCDSLGYDWKGEGVKVEMCLKVRRVFLLKQIIHLSLGYLQPEVMGARPKKLIVKYISL